ARTPQSSVRWPVWVAAALTFGTGAIDVTTLTRHGGVFSSVITGNLVLTGLAFARADSLLLAHTGAAIAGFVLGVAGGARITGARDPDGPPWPRSVTVVLGVEFVVLCGFTVGWEAIGTAPRGVVQLGLLTAAAAAMGLQSAAMRGLGVPVATTYLTGALTGVIAGWARSARLPSDRAALTAVVAAVAGAISGGVLVSIVPAAVPLLILAPLAAVLAAALYHHRSAGASSPPLPSMQAAAGPAL
ncbi:MAG: hypothetical protein QOE41_4470, partial [Mycobacterium sp.]|nr:hypothetical protein [Mycobacterium sp.]